MKPTDLADIPTGSPSLAGYDDLLRDIKERVKSARVRAAAAVNSELIVLYWHIGAEISKRMNAHGWGTKIVDQLAVDLRREFPDMHGFSLRNLRYMRSFAEAWTDYSILQRLVAKLPWGHNVRILDYLEDQARREWYARAAVEYGWSRNVLVHQIEGKLYERQGKASTNFDRSLPSPQSDPGPTGRLRLIEDMNHGQTTVECVEYTA